MSRFLCLKFALVLCWVSPVAASAFVLPKFQRAQLLQPQHIQVDAGLSGGDEQWSLLGVGRIGLSEAYEAQLALGTVLVKEEVGFETSFGIKKHISLADAEKNGFLLSAVGDAAVTKAGLLLAASFDPMLVGERQFRLTDERVFFITLGLGLASTIIDESGEPNEVNLGVAANLGGGLDITDKWRGILDLSFRDGIKRLAVGASTRF